MGLLSKIFSRKTAKTTGEAITKTATVAANTSLALTKRVAREQKMAGKGGRGFGRRLPRRNEPRYYPRGSVAGLESVNRRFFKDPATGRPLKKYKRDYSTLFQK